MKIKLTRYADSADSEQLETIYVARDGHLSFQILDDDDEPVFDGMIWNHPVMIGVTKESTLYLQPIGLNNINLK